MSDKYYNKFLFNDSFDLNLTTDTPELIAAAKSLCADIGYDSDIATKNCKILLCNLVCARAHSPERYLSVSLSPNCYLQNRYNPSYVGYRPIENIIKLLVQNGYLEFKGHYLNFDFNTGYRTRIRPTAKLAGVFGQYGLKQSIVKDHPNKEVLILKGETVKETIYQKGFNGKTYKRKANVAALKDYPDKDHLNRMRGVILRYNGLLAKSYIDVDETGYVPDSSRMEDIVINLGNRSVRRIFNGDFRRGGRFYGGFWQSIPGDLRRRIIINGHNIIEIDFSGMHIHILYAMKGLKLRMFNRLPYIITKDNDQKGYRPYYKRLLLTAMNCKSDRACLYEVCKDVTENPEDYPHVYDRKKIYQFLKKRLAEIKAYHPEISDYLNKGKGIYAQYYDSQIANSVINDMTHTKIPVLCVHDSFICAFKYEIELRDAMTKAYIKVINNELRKQLKVDIHISEDDVNTDIDTLIDSTSDRYESYDLINAISTYEKQGRVAPAISSFKSERSTSAKPIKLYMAIARADKYFMHSAINANNKQIKRFINYRAEGKQTFSTYIVIKKQDITNATVIANDTNDKCDKDTSE